MGRIAAPDNVANHARHAGHADWGSLEKRTAAALSSKIIVIRKVERGGPREIEFVPGKRAEPQRRGRRKGTGGIEGGQIGLDFDQR